MKKKGYSARGLFGQINHYDAHGKKIGESRPGFLGGMNHYDNAELDYAASDTPGAFAPHFPMGVSPPAELGRECNSLHN